MKTIDAPVFVVLVRYTQPVEAVMKHLEAHREFIASGYARGIFLVSGRGADDDPGVVVASGVSRQELQQLMKQDPFHKHSMATYEVLQFHASRACDELGQLFPSP